VPAALVALVVALVLSTGALGETRAKLEPNEPVWQLEWALHHLDMPTVWGITTGSPDIVIATVDTGVDPSIADLRDNLVPGWDFIVGDSAPRDTAGHGTHLASALVAKGNNGTGIAGYCWQCRLMPVRISADGKASGASIARGIRWAVDHGARLVVIGLNSGDDDPDEHEAVRYATSKGALVVASAGNTGRAEPRFPAAFPEVLAVAATNDSDVLYFWSTRGDWVQLAAPGCHMIIDPAVGPGTLCGTSFTPAAVAGVAALLWSLKPSLTAGEIRDALVRTAKPVTGIGGGRIDPMKAIEALGLLPAAPAAPVQPQTPPAQPSGSAQSTTATRKATGRRSTELTTGVMRGTIRRTLKLAAGRLEVQFQAVRAGECVIAVAAPRDYLLSLLPPSDPTLLSMTELVRAGRHTVEISCSPARRRSYTIAITAQRPVAAAARR
jgi:subtilisin family serine protease